MPEAEINQIIEKARIIVNGYAFILQDDGFVSILNLEHTDCAMVINLNLEIIEIAAKNMQFLENGNA